MAEDVARIIYALAIKDQVKMLQEWERKEIKKLYVPRRGQIYLDQHRDCMVQFWHCVIYQIGYNGTSESQSFTLAIGRSTSSKQFVKVTQSWGVTISVERQMVSVEADRECEVFFQKVKN